MKIKDLFLPVMFLLLFLGVLSSAQAQENEPVIDSVVYDTMYQTYHIEYHLGEGGTVQLIMIKHDNVSEKDLDNKSLLAGQRVNFIDVPKKKGNYQATVFFNKSKECCIPSFALIDSEGKTLDRVSTHALGDWTKRSKEVDTERTDIEVEKTEIKRVYQDPSSRRVVVFCNVSKADAPVIISVAEQVPPYKRLVEIPIESEGEYKVSVGHIHTLRDIEAKVYDSNRSKILASKSSVGDRPSRISGLTYNPTQKLAVVELDLQNPSILKVYDRKGHLTRESAVLRPGSNPIWIIQPEKTEFLRVDLEETKENGTVLSSANLWDATESSDSVDFFLQIYQHTPIAKGAISAVCFIPEDYKNPEVVETSSRAGASIHSVTPGSVYSLSKTGNISAGDCLTIIILNDGDMSYVYRVHVRSSTMWGPYLQTEKIDPKSPGLKVLVGGATRY